METKQPLEFHIKLSKEELKQLLEGKIDFIEVVGPVLAETLPTLLIIERKFGGD